MSPATPAAPPADTEQRYALASDWRGTVIWDRQKMVVIAITSEVESAKQLVDAANAAGPATPTPEGRNFKDIAEQIIRSHEDFCLGHVTPESAWCSCMPQDQPLCGPCSKLRDAIVAALVVASGPAVSHQRENVGTVEPDFHTVLSQRQFASDGQTPTSGATVPAAVSPQPEPPPEVSADYAGATLGPVVACNSMQWERERTKPCAEVFPDNQTLWCGRCLLKAHPELRLAVSQPPASPVQDAPPKDEKDHPIWQLCNRLDMAFRSLLETTNIDHVHQWARSSPWITAEIRGHVRKLSPPVQDALPDACKVCGCEVKTAADVFQCECPAPVQDALTTLDVLEFVCPRCKAIPGMSCVDRQSGQQTDTHSSRMRKFTAEYRRLEAALRREPPAVRTREATDAEVKESAKRMLTKHRRSLEKLADHPAVRTEKD